MLVKRISWFWIALFVFGVITLGTLATSWNVVLFQNYDQMLDLARQFNIEAPEKFLLEASPWVSTILGSIGFLFVFGITVLLFVRLIQENRLNRRQSDFLARVTHELKTPIATIELTSDLLRRKLKPTSPSDEDVQEVERLWKLHRDELSRLKQEVSALLAAARWEEKPDVPKLVVMNLEKWVDQSTERWEQILGPAGQLSRAGSKLEREVITDPALLALITNNLVDNARKFARKHPHVTIETEIYRSKLHLDDPDSWEIRFVDQGWGFSSWAHRKVFRRFFRDKNFTSHAIPGTGLGLHLSKKAAKSLGLKLIAKSEGVGKGATFILRGRWKAQP